MGWVVHRLDQNHASNKNILFLPVAYLSAFNFIVNVIRPNASIMWQVRAFQCEAFLFPPTCHVRFFSASYRFMYSRFILLHRLACLVFYVRYKTNQIETYTSRFGRTFFLQPDRPCFFQSLGEKNKKQKFVTRNPGDTMGVSRLWLFLLPVGRPRPFCSRARVYRAMGDAPYRRRHKNRAGGGV
jgi:hypothetical protein